jgi:hypothetical protein
VFQRIYNRKQCSELKRGKLTAASGRLRFISESLARTSLGISTRRRNLLLQQTRFPCSVFCCGCSFSQFVAID